MISLIFDRIRGQIVTDDVFDGVFLACESFATTIRYPNLEVFQIFGKWFAFLYTLIQGFPWVSMMSGEFRSDALYRARPRLITWLGFSQQGWLLPLSIR